MRGRACLVLICHQEKRTFGGWRTSSRDFATHFRVSYDILRSSWKRSSPCFPYVPTTVVVLKGRIRPLKKFEKFGIFSKLSKLSNFPRSTMWKWTSTSRSVFVHFHIVESGKLESLENTPLLLQPKDRSAQYVQDQASLSPAATRAGFSSPPRPQISILHGIRSVTLGHD